MSKKTTDDPSMARFLRNRIKNDGHDHEQQQQDASFNANPSQAISKYSKKNTLRDLNKQVEYFGNAIQPFHMRSDEDYGNIDEDGFFVFNRKRGHRDAWLQSVGEAEDADVADKLVKKIKSESRFQSVYEGDEQMNGNYEENEISQSDKDSKEQQEQQEQEQQLQQKQAAGATLTECELLQLMIELIPNKGNANNYMKKLKSQKNLMEYNKLLTISNQYIEKTGSYNILTMKKDELIELLEEKNRGDKREDEDEEVDWNDEGDEQQQEEGREIQKTEIKKADDDSDNIF